ncbi:MAG: radical SAM protein [Desulfobacteraceae bacterium]|nr:radical SAM protein [Desulfobacteraceae bacterium]
MTQFVPAYIDSLKKSNLKNSVQLAKAKLSGCTLCPRQCAVDRASEKLGYCKTGVRAIVASYDAHFGEEEPLVGRHGSGTIFFTHCNLLCLFCQNYDISHEGMGKELSNRQLADIMLHLQQAGCHNINFVTPSHVVPQILEAVYIAARQGLKIPLVYNSGGYDSVDTLKLLDGIIDIYMPDFKFWDSSIAEQMCNARNYPQAAQAALLEMHRQVGDLVCDEHGLAQRGLLVRHLVMPEGLSGTEDIMAFIAKKISKNTYVNVMAQYRPCGAAHKDARLSRPVSVQEHLTAVEQTKKQGITRLDKRRKTFVIW